MVTDKDSSNKKIAKNTLFLYIRMLLMMGITFYTSRIVLEALGVEDYGIFNVVGGVVNTAIFFKTTLSSACQRFFAYEMGQDNFEGLKKVFSNNLAIHLILCFIIIILGETLGLWFLNSQMSIPTDRLFAANVVYQCTLASFAFTLINVPYNGLIIAHERMSAFAYISIVESVLKLLIAFAVLYSTVDKLIVYAFLWLMTNVVNQVIYWIYSFRHFPESKTSPSLDMNYCKSILSFSGYNLCEIFANMLNDHGINILLNIYFGPAINAARGIAHNLNGAINGFMNNFAIAVNPQITKSYASSNFSRMWSLVSMGNRLYFYLLLVIAVPFFFKADYIMVLWLKNPPELSSEFLRLMILSSLFLLPTRTFYTTVCATGNIKHFQLMFGGYKLLILPICWLLLKYIDANALYVYYIIVLFDAISVALKLYLLKHSMPDFECFDYIKKVLIPLAILAIVIFSLNYLIATSIQDSLFNLLYYIAISVVLSISVIIIIGLNKQEKHKAYCLFISKIRKR